MEWKRMQKKWGIFQSCKHWGESEKILKESPVADGFTIVRVCLHLRVVIIFLK